jgi:hypothetical protein
MKQGIYELQQLCTKDSSFIVQGRIVSIKYHSHCLLLQVTFALNHVKVPKKKRLNKSYAKVTQKPSLY